jgi:hypothetical protein
MAAASEAQRFVALHGGLVIPAEPLRLVLDLQARGFLLRPDGGDLVVSPFRQLTAEDCRQLRRWKYHVLAVLQYEAPTCA